MDTYVNTFLQVQGLNAGQFFPPTKYLYYMTAYSEVTDPNISQTTVD